MSTSSLCHRRRCSHADGPKDFSAAVGSLKDFSAADLGGIAIKGALEKAGVSPDQVDYVIMGQVIQAGSGQNAARQAAVKGGIGMDVPAITINKVCLSGINAIALADQLIRAGEYEVVVAGGMESMTQGPHLLSKSRSGFKYGDVTMLDATAYDASADRRLHRSGRDGGVSPRGTTPSTT
jgi:acetyl-CoA C-acetyltransferase